MDGKKSYEIESSCYHLDENKTNSGEKKEKIRKKNQKKKKRFAQNGCSHSTEDDL